MEITDEQKQEFLTMYYEENKSVEEAAEACGFSQRSGYYILKKDSAALSKYLNTVKAGKIRAEIRVVQEAENAVMKQVELMNKPLADNLLYIQQNAARDILDRAGVRAATEEKQDVKITFADGGFDIGMPEPEEDTGGDNVGE